MVIVLPAVIDDEVLDRVPVPEWRGPAVGEEGGADGVDDPLPFFLSVEALASGITVFMGFILSLLQDGFRTTIHGSTLEKRSQETH